MNVSESFIAGTLNIRGFDIQYNPLAYSYLLITENDAHLFIDSAKVFFFIDFPCWVK